ncbi:MAG: AMP-binding protein, partial [Anaerolineales bacterium]|nr:AMP-binding protein [Anaerolineales bacterium]
MEDGDVEYLGRIDHQVKIRGFRIELGEIETALAAYAGIREVCVLAREDVPGEKRLVAYLVTPAGAEVTTAALRQHLQQTLPDYMIPAAYVLLDGFPLTTNGKIDRRALPAPVESRSELLGAYVAPRNEVERALAHIWAQVLGVAQVGVHDNFFDLGGDSMLSLRIVAQAEAAGVSVSLRDLFTQQTIAELAAVARPTDATVTKAVAVPFALIADRDRERLPADVVDAYPLTRLQAGMFFHSEFSPETAVYQNVTSWHVRAPFVQAMWETAVQQLAMRHAILRTAFDLSSYSQPLQLVYAQAAIPLEVHDWQQMPAAAQEAALQTWLAAELQRRFDWTQPPLLRFAVHRRSAETFQFSFSEHHAILDGWSVAVMATELFRHYFHLLGQAVPAPTVPQTAFRDFVALEQQVIADAAQAAFWQTQLQELPALTLPDWGAAETPVGNLEYRHELSPDLLASLQSAAREIGVPLKSVLLAAHLRVLAAISGQTEVVTGLVTGGRPETADSDRALGLFLNTVPFRQALRGGSWRELAQAVFAAEQEIRPYQRYPLAEIRRLHRQASGAHSSDVFETIFNFVHFHELGGLRDLTGFDLLEEQFVGSANFPLGVDFELLPQGPLHLLLEYDTGRFAEAQMARLAGYYERMLVALAADVNGRYEQVSPLAAMERAALQQLGWGGAQSTPAQTVAALFAESAARTPGATAVAFADQTLTYGELDARANQLAHYLQAQGVGPNTLVALLLERSPEMAVGLLGILKAGGAYVPLDPKYPTDRLQYMLADSEAALLLTQADLRARLTMTKPVLCLDADWAAQIAAQPTTPPASMATPQSLAYLIYTSGSTGQPKGVMVPQQALVNHNLALIAQYGLTTADRVLQFAALSFDVAAEEMFPTWLSGGTVVLRTETVLASFADFTRFVDEQGMTVLNLPASYWQEWVGFLVATGTAVP